MKRREGISDLSRDQVGVSSSSCCNSLAWLDGRVEFSAIFGATYLANNVAIFNLIDLCKSLANLVGWWNRDIILGISLWLRKKDLSK